jgi:hypothetical protein
VEFDELCADVGDFEPLPAVTNGPLERDPEDEEDTGLDEQILVGLVLPV